MWGENWPVNDVQAGTVAIRKCSWHRSTAGSTVITLCCWNLLLVGKRPKAIMYLNRCRISYPLVAMVSIDTRLAEWAAPFLVPSVTSEPVNGFRFACASQRPAVERAFSSCVFLPKSFAKRVLLNLPLLTRALALFR
jgi:hypothetical protein